MGKIFRLIGGLLLVAVITGLGGVTLNANGGTEWPQFHQDAANSGNTTSTAPSDNSLLWVSDDIGAAESSSVAVADSQVFVYANDNVTCLNESTGAVVWTSPALDASSWDSWSSPAYHSGNVFIGSGTKIYSLDATDGSIDWSYDIPSGKEVTNGSVTVADSKVFVGDWEGASYYCLNEADGSHAWTFSVTGYAQGTPAYDNGMVYLTSWVYGGNGHIYCVNADSGSQVWHQTTSLPVAGSATIADSVVYFATYNFGGTGNLSALNAADGTTIWESVAIQSTDATPAIADGKVYITGGSPGWWDLATYCFDASDGSQLWKIDDIGGWTCSMAVADGAVIVGTLKDAWSGVGSYGTYALNPTTGATLWSSVYGGSSPAVANSRVFTVAQGRVYAFGTPAASLAELEPTQIELPTFINEDEANTITATVKNNGTDTATGIAVTLHADTTLIETETIASLAAGAETSVDFSWTPDAGDYTLKVTADPDNAIPESDTGNNELTQAVSAPQMKLALLSGWNFIATPKELKDGHSTAGQVFGSVNTDSHSIWGYAEPDGWQALTSDNTVAPLDGIWLYSSGADEIYFAFDTDPLRVPPTKSLSAGWSAVGFSDVTAASADSALTSVESKWAYLLGFDASTQQYEDSIINNTTSGDHAESRLMSPGRGYWLYMTADGELAAIGN